MDFMIQFWPIALGFVAFGVWLVRLEARAMDNTKEIKRLWNQRREDLEASKEARDDTNKVLAEIRADIKTLISKVGGRL
ncbi:MAG: hypothetical protein EBY40_04625 [Marivivens sp.]|nr:hypothetical protein [Marivivens sp.]NBT50442.1 hypothetical protein [Marivivens sp.]NCW68741.1 hypothetical protein [Marivivens sp.]NDH02398.1 hypothetical protein [Marivivens sp.]